MQKTPLSIRVIYILTSVVYYLTIFASSFGIIFALGLITGFWGDDVQLHTEMPFKANVIETGEVMFLGREVKVELVEASGKFHYIDTPPFVARIHAIPMFVIFPLMFWIVYLFHRFVRNVSEGRIFTERNFRLLRKLGFSLGVLWIFAVVYMNVMKYVFFGELSFNTVGFSSKGGNWFAGVLIGALFTLVLSHIFLQGLKLQEENELTI